jgi:hypothetical protein
MHDEWDITKRHYEALGSTEQHVWDLYAAAALGGYLANPSVSRDNGILWAAVCADGLLAERRRRVETPVTGNGVSGVRVVGNNNGKVSR